MIYIVTEDSNSARDFWKIAAELCCKKPFYMMPMTKNSGGNRGLEKRTIEAADKAAKDGCGNIVLSIFDSIDSTDNSYFPTKEYIKRAKKYCKAKNVTFKYVRYYCFEEMFLSYDGLCNMYTGKLKDVLLEIHDYIREHPKRNYFYCCDKVRDYIKELNSRGINVKNRETLANIILSEITHVLPGHFMITKTGHCFDSSAMCWVKDCSDVQKITEMNTYKIKNVCECTCNYCCKFKTAEDKVNDIAGNNIKRW